MPHLRSRSPQDIASNSNGIGTQEFDFYPHARVFSEPSPRTQESRRSNPRLDAITAQSPDKAKRRAVKAIAADYEKLQMAGIPRTDLPSFIAGRERRIEALTSMQTRLAQISATGLTQRTPGISISRSAKNGLALLGGATSRVGQVVAGSTAVAGTAAAAAAVAPFSVASGFFSIVAGACFLNNPCSERDIDRFFYTSGVQSIVFPVRASYRFLRSDCLAGAIGSLNAFPSAMTYVTRPRLSTAIIAAGTAAQISAELTRYYSGALTDEERAFLDAHGSAISRTDTPLAMSSQSSESPAVPSGVSAIDRTSRWYFPETEFDAIAFNAFQAQVTETAEYRNPHSKPGVVRRIDLLVEAMRASPSLRATCFAIASDAAQTCGDRVALGLNDMEQALLIENAESGKLSPEDLFSKGIGSFKKQVLDEIALAKINDLKRLGIPADEIEIRLAFQTELFERLDLPGVTNEMRYRASAKVSKGEIASAERAVRQKIAQGDAISFLTQWRPWCKAMEKTDPEAFRALADAAQAKRDAISIMPAHMSDQEWINALAKQKNDEETQTADLLKRTTLRFISEHGLQVA